LLDNLQFLPRGGFAQVAGRPDHLSKLESLVTPVYDIGQPGWVEIASRGSGSKKVGPERSSFLSTSCRLLMQLLMEEQMVRRMFLFLLFALAITTALGCQPAATGTTIATSPSGAAVSTVTRTATPLSSPTAVVTASATTTAVPSSTLTPPALPTTPPATIPATLPPTTSPEPVQSEPDLQPKIVFSAAREDEEADIYVMDPDGSGVTQLTFHPAYDSRPAWSPDGKRIAFFSRRSEDGNADIFVMSREGEDIDLFQLTDDPADDADPSWSPDGTRITFMSERDGNREIYVMNSDGSGAAQRLTYTTDGAQPKKSERQPAWSPVEDLIAFESRRTGPPEIYIMFVDGTNQHPLTSSAGDNFNPRWSPDGSQIVFASTRDPVNLENRWAEIYIMDADGTRQTRLTNNHADDEAPAWSPDGEWIIFASKRDSCEGQREDGDCDWDLYLMRTNGSALKRLTATSDLSEFNPVWWAPSVRP